jgi:hypothetical protein
MIVCTLSLCACDLRIKSKGLSAATLANFACNSQMSGFNIVVSVCAF